jgi:TonB family protein
MKKTPYIAIIISLLIHGAIISVFILLTHSEPEGILGGGGTDGGKTGGTVAVSVIEGFLGSPGNFSFRKRMHSTNMIRDSKESSESTASSVGTGSPGSGGGFGGGTGGGIGPGKGKGDPRLSRIWLKINRSKYYPRIARKNGWEGSPRIRFAIDSDGQVNSVNLVKSCGIPELDEAALETIRRSAPLPYYPKTITLAIRYSLDK